jgi:hypothetical protein
MILISCINATCKNNNAPKSQIIHLFQIGIKINLSGFPSRTLITPALLMIPMRPNHERLTLGEDTRFAPLVPL